MLDTTRWGAHPLHPHVRSIPERHTTRRKSSDLHQGNTAYFSNRTTKRTKSYGNCPSSINNTPTTFKLIMTAACHDNCLLLLEIVCHRSAEIPAAVK